MDADTSKIHDILEYMKIWKDIMNNLEIDFVLLKRRCISICNFDAKIVCVAYPAFAIFRGDCYYHRRHIEHTFFWSHVGGFCSQLCAHLEFIKFLNKKLFKSRFFNQNRICHNTKMHWCFLGKSSYPCTRICQETPGNRERMQKTFSWKNAKKCGKTNLFQKWFTCLLRRAGVPTEGQRQQLC